MKPFFFDIETGGFSKKSSILSISFGTSKQGLGPGDIQSFYAQPTKGSFISRWSEKNVWEPIQRLGVVPESEEAILKKFLGKLQDQEGRTVAGWNIGWRPGGRGFDIPMLMARAEKYGLGREYQQAFGKLTVRDIGQEYAYKIAKEASVYEHLVTQGKLPTEIFESAKAYAGLGLRYEAGHPLLSKKGAERQAARYLAEEFKSVTGWKQELAHGLFAKGGYQAHLSAADVASGIGLTERLERGRLFKGEAGVVKWGREAFYKSLVSQAMRPADMYKGKPEVPTEKYPRIIAAAERMETTGGRAYRGFSKRVVAGINEEAAQRGAKIGDILAGKGAPDVGRIVRGSTLGTAEAFGLGDFIKKVPKFLWKHKLPVGIGAAVVGAYATQPLRLLDGAWFSGRDDAYNTIEGMPEGGEAQRMRRLLTDFGSGWLGSLIGRATRGVFRRPGPAVIKLPKVLGQFVKQKGVAGSPEQLMETVHGALLSAPEAMFRKASRARARLDRALMRLPEDRRAVMINPWEIKWGAREAGISYRKAYKGTVEHESFHAAIPESLRDQLWKLEGMVPQKFRGKFLPTLGADRWTEFLWSQKTRQLTTEEYFSHFLSARASGKISEKHMKEIWQPAQNLFSGKDDAWNTVRGLMGGGEAERLRKIMTEFGSGWRGLIKLFGMGGQKLGTLGRKMARPFQERFWKFGKPGPGDFAIRATELGKMSREQIVQKLGGLPKFVKPPTPKTGEGIVFSAADLRKMPLEQVRKGLGLSPLPGKIKTFGDRPRAILKPKMVPKMPAGEVPRMPGVGGFEPESAIVRSKVPKHEAMIAGQVASAGRRARFYKAHTEGKIRASTNAHRPGQRHTDPTGTITL